MAYRLLVSGDRSSFTILAFDPATTTLRSTADYTAPYNASWVEPVSSHSNIDSLIGLSEGDDAGLLYSFEIDHTRKTCRITSQQPTLGAPAHFTSLKDNSAIALATYYGGSTALYPISISDEGSVLLTETNRVEILPQFPYESVKHGPVEARQRQCHSHQVLEDSRGLLYAPDLGSDRVWIYRRDGLSLEECGWLQCPSGHGPRHAVLTSDENLMYVIGELAHTVVAFDLSTSPAEAIEPIIGFAPNVIPSSIDPKHQRMMDSSEICLHPRIRNVLYVSNRWARHFGEREPCLEDIPATLPPGDAVAIILLSADGRKVESIKHVQTKLDVIRGMRLSDDGKYVLVVGQLGGGVEIYGIDGERGDCWNLIASLREDIESGIKHAVWL